MKLAEALQERADLNIRIQQLRSRLENNAFVQEGEQPAEDPDDLLSELNENVKRLEWLISRINLTNCVTSVEGRTLTEIAMLSGFQSIPSFNRVFREEKGMSPGEYRALFADGKKERKKQPKT